MPDGNTNNYQHGAKRHLRPFIRKHLYTITKAPITRSTVWVGVVVGMTDNRQTTFNKLSPQARLVGANPFAILAETNVAYH